MGIDDGQLRRLSEQTAEILDASGQAAICEQAVTSVEAILGEALAVILLYDRGREAIVPQATTDPDLFEHIRPEYDDRHGVAWEVFSTSQSTRIDPEQAGTGIVSDLQLPGGQVVSLGNHGVLLLASSIGNRATDTENGATDTGSAGGTRQSPEPDETKPNETKPDSRGPDSRVQNEGVDGSFARILASLVESALDRAERERGLRGVQEITLEALTAERPEDVAETVLAYIPDALDLPVSSIWEWDAGQEALVPVASTAEADELFGEIPTFEAGESLAWKAFHRQETRVYEDVGEDPDVHNPDSPVKSEVLVPIGTFGVLATGSTHRDSFTNTERRLLETLAANVETALRLVNRREELQLQDQVLARILRHNIRNDLTAVQGFATQITEQASGEVEHLAHSIIDRCLGLEKTANHAREMQTIVRRSDRRTTVSLREAVGFAVKTTKTAYPSAEIDAYLQGDPQVSAHPDISTAVRHLIENGIVHHPNYGDATPEADRGGTSEGVDDGAGERDRDAARDVPSVTVRVFETDLGAGVSVEDTGSGIPRNELEVLETRGETSLSHGSGVGLWIVDRLVSYSGASLSFDTGVDGTTVEIRFE